MCLVHKYLPTLMQNKKQMIKSSSKTKDRGIGLLLADLLAHVAGELLHLEPPEHEDGEGDANKDKDHHHLPFRLRFPRHLLDPPLPPTVHRPRLHQRVHPPPLPHRHRGHGAVGRRLVPHAARHPPVVAHDEPQRRRAGHRHRPVGPDRDGYRRGGREGA
uniref:Uncharacterized protein n=1 Tax=Arundo donax TaxID=35708 RepID=A0A0A9D5P8_ARUDO